MTVERVDIAAHLDTQFSILAQAIEQAASDATAAGYGSDIDLALRDLGVARDDLESATLDDSLEKAAFALAEYYAARRFFRQFGVMIGVKADDSQFDYKQAQTNVKTMMDEAERLAVALGYNPVPTIDSITTPTTYAVDVQAVW